MQASYSDRTDAKCDSILARDFLGHVLPCAILAFLYLLKVIDPPVFLIEDGLDVLPVFRSNGLSPACCQIIYFSDQLHPPHKHFLRIFIRVTVLASQCSRPVSQNSWPCLVSGVVRAHLQEDQPGFCPRLSRKQTDHPTDLHPRLEKPHTWNWKP